MTAPTLRPGVVVIRIDHPEVPSVELLAGMHVVIDLGPTRLHDLDDGRVRSAAWSAMFAAAVTVQGREPRVVREVERIARQTWRAEAAMAAASDDGNGWGDAA